MALLPWVVAVLPVAVLAQTAPGSTGQVAPTEPLQQQTGTSKAGAQPSGNFLQTIWGSDTLTGDWGGLRKELLDDGITLGLQEQSEGWANLTGGIRRGVVYTGLTTASVRLDLGKLAGWDGATFFVSGYQIHGHGPSTNLVGNNQLVSNIEATRDTKLYALWLEQSLLSGDLTIRIGQGGANDQMMITQYGALYLNSSFGFPGLAAANLPDGGPNYPIAAPFVSAKYRVNDNVSVIGGVFSGDPAPSGPGDPQLRDRGGVAFNWHDHALAIAELWYSVNQGDNAKGLPATYKVGAWFDSAHFADPVYDSRGNLLANPLSDGVARSHSGMWALYGIVDQLVWQKPGTKNQGIGVFLQVMGSPNGYGVSNLFIEGGINWMGPFAGRDNDTFGIAATYLGISPSLRDYSRQAVAYTGQGFAYAGNETVLEMTYLLQATAWLAIQPDMQVVFNPNAGMPSQFSNVPLKNAVVLGVRATVTF